MGTEETITYYVCGCVYYESYDEACGMGAIPGTQKNYWKQRCSTHLRDGGWPAELLKVVTPGRLPWVTHHGPNGETWTGAPGS